jgi:predicted NBD/HSP70 family sugar kinase
MHYIGIDIGGSRTKAVLVKDKEILQSLADNTPPDFAALLNLLSQMSNELRGSTEVMEIGGIGCAVAGVLDKEREKILRSPNISFLDGQPMKNLLEEKFKVPVCLEHDVHCFLLAEKEIGLAKDFKNVFYLTLGTGIGGAFMVDGKIQYGAHGAAGEAGHMIVDAINGLDLEELASNKFIVKSLGVGSIEALKRAQKGDNKAIEVFKSLGHNLGAGIANIINIFDPEAIILSGGISEAREFILTSVLGGIEKYAISPEAKNTKILFSKLGNFGGALGAAMLFSMVED